LTVRHPAAVAVIMFTIAIAGFVLGPILGLPRLLGKYWAGEYYLAVLGGTFLYVSLFDPSRKKHVTPYVSADDKGAFRRPNDLFPNGPVRCVMEYPSF